MHIEESSNRKKSVNNSPRKLPSCIVTVKVELVYSTVSMRDTTTASKTSQSVQVSYIHMHMYYVHTYTQNNAIMCMVTLHMQDSLEHSHQTPSF